MTILYNFSIWFLGLFLTLAARFSHKARLWVDGRKSWSEKLSAELRKSSSLIWFHASSLGEFEQGRPIIERVRNDYPNHQILLTFYSPSGYEVRKDFSKADYVCYLPLDTPGNAEKFLDITRPKLAIFIRYEFWHNFLRAMFKRDIPVVTVSAIFRKNQIFFKPYGAWFRKTLRGISYFFAQNQVSLDLLDSIGITNTVLSGDTRLDRVWEAVQKKREFPFVKKFLAGKMCLMAGSTWPYDNKLLNGILPEFPDLKFVIVPHHVDDANIRRTMDLFGDRAVLYTQGEDQDLQEKQVLVVDTMGMLAYLYRLADLTYIGEGFGKGIHSILEPAAFGIPVFFGPNYHKFQEAVDLVERRGVFCVKDRTQLIEVIRYFVNNEEERQGAGRICRDYIIEKKGATEKVMEGLKEFLE
ncbi:MAG: hypothetical protein BA865_04180 [Desulfobacterales bacterium S5133MH4]|nr:MAG: hypothetical protein BA865_04180 [Desulfobacterales bacterium S5133MH4]